MNLDHERFANPSISCSARLTIHSAIPSLKPRIDPSLQENIVVSSFPCNFVKVFSGVRLELERRSGSRRTFEGGPKNLSLQETGRRSMETPPEKRCRTKPQTKKIMRYAHFPNYDSKCQFSLVIAAISAPTIALKYLSFQTLFYFLLVLGLPKDSLDWIWVKPLAYAPHEGAVFQLTPCGLRYNGIIFGK